MLGKYQPIACSTSIILKQCIQLPKPLFHEVLELCGDDLSRVSQIELSKRDDLKFEFVDDDDEDYYYDDDDEEEYKI